MYSTTNETEELRRLVPSFKRRQNVPQFGVSRRNLDVVARACRQSLRNAFYPAFGKRRGKTVIGIGFQRLDKRVVFMNFVAVNDKLLTFDCRPGRAGVHDVVVHNNLSVLAASAASSGFVASLEVDYRVELVN